MDCEMFDPVSFVIRGPKGQAEEEHVGGCRLCADEVEEVKSLLREPVGEDLAAAFGDTTLATLGSIEVPDFMPVREEDGYAEALFSFPIPLLSDEVSEGRSFARLTLEPSVDWVSLRGVRLKVTIAKGQQLLPIGVPVKVWCTLDEDAYVFVAHCNGKREVQGCYPTPKNPDPFWRAGPGHFSGIIEGCHGERQQFVIIATKAPILPRQIPFGDPKELEAMYLNVLDKIRALPEERWCKVVFPYTAVDLEVVESYREKDLRSLEEVCLRELKDKEDRAKTACGEVLRQFFTLPDAEKRKGDNPVQNLLVEITQKLIRRWVNDSWHTWNDQVLQDPIQNVYAEFFQTARRQPLLFTSTFETLSGQPVQLACYSDFLGYLKKITVRHVFPDWRKERRAKFNAFLRFMHRYPSRLPLVEKNRFQEWVCQNVLQDGVEEKIFSCALEGNKPKKMLEDPEIKKAFTNLSPKRSANWELANARDSSLWRVYEAVRRGGPEDLKNLIAHMIAVTTVTPGEYEWEDSDDEEVSASE